MQSKNSLMAIFFIATLGIMLVISGVIFIIYCIGYEIKNKKKVYREAKKIAIICIVIGLLMAILSFLYLNNRGI